MLPQTFLQIINKNNLVYTLNYALFGKSYITGKISKLKITV
jgi:hypothetical protein